MTCSFQTPLLYELEFYAIMWEIVSSYWKESISEGGVLDYHLTVHVRVFMCLCSSSAYECVCVCSRTAYDCIYVCNQVMHMSIHACVCSRTACVHTYRSQGSNSRVFLQVLLTLVFETESTGDLKLMK